jgi:hypothetical protein
VGPFNQSACAPDGQCTAALSCLLASSDCWLVPAPAGCYCGANSADIDACEDPTFVPTGPCAAELRAGAGAGATNKEVLERYFDGAYATGNATIIMDAAFIDCNAECF